jgi:hypothetical protein
MPSQVIRLAIAFGILITGFLVFRSVAVPSGFGEAGFHRKEALGLVASREMVHAGRKACLECHEDLAKTTKHFEKHVGCESCHGAAKKHTEDPSAVKPHVPDTREDCAKCHAMIVGRPMAVPQVVVADHNPGQKCMSCHSIHSAE